MDIARIRHELRVRLMHERTDGVWDLLADLRRLANGQAEMLGEHARWQMRFELLAASPAPARM